MKLSRYILPFLIFFGMLAVAPQARAASRFHDALQSEPESNPAIRIEMVGGDSLAVDPGEVVTLVYKITTTRAKEITYDPEFDIPPNWSIVFGTDPITSSSASPTTRFVTYKIPANELADTFTLELTLIDPDGAEAASKISKISINKIVDIDFVADPVPSFAAAGKRVSTSFTLFNAGNTPVSVLLSSMDRPFASTRLPFKSIDLAPKGSATFEAHIDTDANLDHTQRASLRFEARLQGYPDIVEFETVAFDIVPIYSRIKPKAAPMPLRLALETVGDESGAIPQVSVAAEVEMLGGKISVSATLAESPRQRSYGADQRISIAYERDNLKIKIGDHSQSISPMTLTGEQGVGLAAQVETSKWEFIGSAQRSRYVFPVQERFAASAAYKTSKTSLLSTNLLHRNGFYNGTLMTARSVSQPFGPTSRFDFECGIDSPKALGDPSCTILVSNSSSRFSYRLRGQRASETFPGTSAGLRQFSEYASARLSNKFRIDNSVRFLERALGDGFERSNSFVKVGLSYTDRLAGGTFYFTTHGMRTRTEYSNLQAVSDRKEDILRATVGFHMRSLGLTVTLEDGTATSSDIGVSGGLSRFRSYARIGLSRVISIDGSFERSSGNLSALSTKQKQRQYGLGSSIRLPKAWTASVSALHSEIQTTIDQQYSSIQTRVKKSFRSGSVFSTQIQMNRSVGRETTRTADYRISYILPLAMPFGRKLESSELLRGRVVNGNSGVPISGVLLFLGDKLAITDSEGRFALPRPEIDIEFLRLDQNSIGYDRVPALSLPLEIGPNAFQNQDLIIPITKAARVSGTISIYRSASSRDVLLGSDDSELVRESGLKGAVIQIENDRHRFRTRTDQHGSFEFSQLPPGGYTVEIIRAYVEDHQRLERRSFKVSLEDTLHKVIEFRILPIKKKIRFINSKPLSLNSLRLEANDNPERRTTVAPAVLKNPTGNTSVEEYTTDDIPISTVTHKAADIPVIDEAPGWYELMLESAMESSLREAGTFSSVFIPHLVDVNIEQRSENRASLYILLFIACIIFVLIDIDLIVRQAINLSRGPIRSLDKPSWTWTVRQALLYGLSIGIVTIWLGVLAGFGISLALSGISIAIETWDTYRAFGNVVLLNTVRKARVGSWIPYRNAAARICSISLAEIEFQLLNGEMVSLPTHAFRRICRPLWAASSVKEVSISIELSRLSNLRQVRELITDRLLKIGPKDTSNNVYIEFIDLSEVETAARVKVLLDLYHPDFKIAKELAEAVLSSAGIDLTSASSPEPGRYGPLRLVPTRDAA